VLDRFRDGKEKVLITTNVLARGEPQWIGFIAVLQKKQTIWVKKCKWKIWLLCGLCC
jgi:late competence protein required for DNA uptake (superfamily II DNA/RNA helicase)